jgi:hypothetical protein
MITGKIRLYEEPVKYKSYQGNWSNMHGFGGMYDDEGYWSGNSKLTAEEQETAILLAINSATILGYIQGARVKRRAGFGTLGTIIHIHRSYTMAYNHSSGQIEPFKVAWDAGPHSAGGTYDYCIDDLILLEEAKNLPVLLIPEKKETPNENVLHLC